MSYICDKCFQEKEDNGPYEMSDGNYCCQDCLEDAINES